MPISFTTSLNGKKGERLFSPLGSEGVTGLPGFDQIKIEDLEVGTGYGPEPRAARTWIDPKTHTYLHGEEGVLAREKNRQ